MAKLTPRARLRQARDRSRRTQNRESISTSAVERRQGLLLRPHEHLDEIRHQLRQELGREPTPQELRAWLESQWRPTDFGQMLADGVQEMLGAPPEKPPGRWRILVQRLLHPWPAVSVARPGHRT